MPPEHTDLPGNGGAPWLLAEWLAAIDVSGRLVAVLGSEESRSVLRAHGARLVPPAPSRPVDLLVVVGADQLRHRPWWYGPAALRPGGYLMLATTLEPDVALAEAVSGLRVPGMDCLSIVEVYEPSGPEGGRRWLRLVQVLPHSAAVMTL